MSRRDQRPSPGGGGRSDRQTGGETGQRRPLGRLPAVSGWSRPSRSSRRLCEPLWRRLDIASNRPEKAETPGPGVLHARRAGRRPCGRFLASWWVDAEMSRCAHSGVTRDRPWAPVGPSPVSTIQPSWSQPSMAVRAVYGAGPLKRMRRCRDRRRWAGKVFSNPAVRRRAAATNANIIRALAARQPRPIYIQSTNSHHTTNGGRRCREARGNAAAR